MATVKTDSEFLYFRSYFLVRLHLKEAAPLSGLLSFPNVSPEEALHVSISWTRKNGCKNEPRTPNSGSDPHRLQPTSAGGRQLMVVSSIIILNLQVHFHNITELGVFERNQILYNC